MENYNAQKRQRAPSDADTVPEAGQCPKRVQGPFAQPSSSVGHATATGSARMVVGNVHGDNIHGNVNTTINNFHSGARESSKPFVGPEASGILSTSERKELMERLRFPQLDARLTNLRKAESHTCDWIIQRKDYDEWLKSDDLKACNGFFWIKGTPGTGKSIAMKFLFQRLQRQLREAKTKDKLVISFFFNARGNEFEKSTLGLYRSLLFNLFTLEPGLQEALDYCQRSGYHNIIESEWQLQMLKEIFEEAVTLLCAQEKQLYCYVDALDECPEDDVQDMVSYFEDLVGNTESRYFRVCFSSRHYPQIFIRTNFTMTLEEEQNHNKDIRIFIESQLQFGDDADPELLQQIRAEILEKSSGIFLWVNLVVHQLNEVQRQDGRIKAVQQRLREIPEAVKKRPAPNGAMPLYGLFQDIIQKDEKNIDKLVQITQIVFCAKRPLHPKELYVLLHQTYDVPFDSNEAPDHYLTKHVLEVSKGLAEVTKSVQPTVQFIHETVREFLRDGGLKSISAQSVNGDGHEILKSSCLKQIHAPLSEHLELLAKYRFLGHYRDTRVNQVTRPRQNEFKEQANDMFPLLEYASKNILFHAEEAEAMGLSQSEFLKNFPIAEWIPTYNLFEKFNTRRYDGNSTPLLYVLAEHGCDHLIKSSAEFECQFLEGHNLRGQYLREVKGNTFSSALACAIHNGHLDTAWTLAGLDPKFRPQETVVPPKTEDTRSGRSSLFQLLQRIGDVPLMRKVLLDLQAMGEFVPISMDYKLFNSSEMIDMFLELDLGVLGGFPSVGSRHKKAQADQGAPEPSRSNTDLIFIRRAIEKKPSLLESKVWRGMTMLDFVVDQESQSLATLYLEYSDGGRSDVDAVLHCAARSGKFSMVKFAHLRGASLSSQDANGMTALHSVVGRHIDLGERGKVLEYLLWEEPSCVNVRDYEGRTALAMAETWVFDDQSHGSHASHFETFLQAGADTTIVRRCHHSQHVRHDVPLVMFLALHGDIINFQSVASDHRCDLDARDGYGRTSLSWLFSHLRMDTYHCSYKGEWAIGEYLLQRPSVNVNSRDDSGYTVLEYFIRQLFPGRYNSTLPYQCFIRKFFNANLLDPNLQTSNGQSPLELIVSLYGTWTTECGEAYLLSHQDTLGMAPGNIFWDPDTYITQVGSSREFNQHLVESLKLLLGTGKVDIDVQLRCAEHAAPELKNAILGSTEPLS